MSWAVGCKSHMLELFSNIGSVVLVQIGSSLYNPIFIHFLYLFYF